MQLRGGLMNKKNYYFDVSSHNYGWYDVLDAYSEKEVIKYIIDDLTNEEYAEEKFNIEIGLRKDYEDYLSAEDIIEDMQVQAYDESDYGIDYLQNIKKEDIDWFQDKLDKLWIEFKNKIKETPPFHERLTCKNYRAHVNNKGIVDKFEEDFE